MNIATDSPKANDFLWTAIKGHYSPEKEDRLTQVFVACFNHSALFRKAALRFFGLQCDVDARSTSQEPSRDRKGRLDIKILNGDEHEIAVVENKIDAILTGNQLGRYRKAGHRKVIAIARNYPQLDKNLKQFNVYRWSEFYSELEKALNTAPAGECLLGASFLRYLEELNMTGLKPITKNDLISACKSISIIGDATGRWKRKTITTINPFYIFNELLKYFKHVYTEAHNDKALRDRFGKNFRFNPYLDLATGNRIDDEVYKNPCVNFSFYSPWQGRSKKIAEVGLHFLIHPTDSHMRGFYAWRYFKNKEYGAEHKIDEFVYQGDMLSREKLARAVISRWKRWLQ